jgi:7-cyano-7-deazaguanine synthase
LSTLRQQPPGLCRELVLLSGGIDSTCLLADCATRNNDLAALFIDYGQPVATIERRASLALAEHFDVRWSEITIGGLTPPPGEIAGRNALLAHLALTWLGNTEPAVIQLGIHAGTNYRDCTPEFVAETQRSLDFQSLGEVRLLAPFVTWPKKLILTRALELGVPIEMTFSCERANSPCGECLSCIDRRELLARA